MSEEIIINDVNVAGCGFLENDEFDCLCLLLYDRYDAQMGCSERKDCYYKQLQRLKKENNRLLKQKNNVMAKNIKYFAALEEIRNNLKDICDRECDFHWCKGTCPDSDCDYYTNINKINEVLDEQ